MRDLYHASRDELIRLVLAQQDELAERDRRLAAVERQLAAAQATPVRLTDQLGALVAADEDPPRGGPPRGMPGLKQTEAPVREKPPSGKRAQNTARHRMQPTARIEHALGRCPDCGAPLAGGTVKRTREVLELPVPTIEVIEHVHLERRCPDCGKRCVPPPQN